MNQNPLFLAVRQLIEDGRLTGATTSLKLDGEPLLAPGDDVIDPVDDATEWTSDGFSVTASEWGGRLSRDVEQVRAELLANGTADDDAAARELPQYFVNVEDAEHSPRQEYQARENHAYVYVIRAMAGFPDVPRVATMQEYSPRYHVKGTNEPEWRYDVKPSQVDVVRGGANPGHAIPNHRILVGKGWTGDKLGQWARAWVQTRAGGAQVNETVG